MNPPVRDAAARAGLWHWLGQGVVDVIGSDHAPHTLDEKAREYPTSPSGMPGVQTLLPVMLDHVAAGRLSLARLVDLTSAGAARLFGIVGHRRIAAGMAASLTVVDLAQRWTITPEWLASRAGWSPFTGMEVTGRPIGTIVRGLPVMWEGETDGRGTWRAIPFRGDAKELKRKTAGVAHPRRLRLRDELNSGRRRTAVPPTLLQAPCQFDRTLGAPSIQPEPPPCGIINL